MIIEVLGDLPQNLLLDGKAAAGLWTRMPQTFGKPSGFRLGVVGFSFGFSVWGSDVPS